MNPPFYKVGHVYQDGGCECLLIILAVGPDHEDVDHEVCYVLMPDGWIRRASLCVNWREEV